MKTAILAIAIAALSVKPWAQTQTPRVKPANPASAGPQADPRKAISAPSRMILNDLSKAAATYGCYSPASSWLGQYSLSATASGAACGGEYTCNVNQSAAATTFAANALVASCSLVGWVTNDQLTSISMDDTATEPCPNGGQYTDDVVGSSGLSGAGLLYVSVGAGTYYYQPQPAVNGTETTTNCIGDVSTQTQYYSPAPWSSPWPETLTLPPAIQPLTADVSFGALSQASFQVPANWSYSYSLTPIYHCKDCKKDGGQGSPVSSSVSPENLSLGEDVPIVGTGFVLHYESSRAPGAFGDPVASTDAAMIGGWTLNVHHAYDSSSNILFLGDGSQRSDYELGSPVVFNQTYLVTSADGSEVYAFSGSGLHLQTLRPMTGAIEYQFGYDSAGELVTVTDATGNVTTIKRNASEQPIAIVSPYGQTTSLSVDASGFLNKVTDPLGKSSTFVKTTTGLLSSRTDPNGNMFTYQYDGAGRLALDSDPLGGFVQFGRADAANAFSWTIAETTSMGRTSSYQSTAILPWTQDGTQAESEEHLNTWPDGLQATSSNSLASGQLTNSVALPDGTSVSQTQGPDPVWGIQVPVTTSETIKEGNLTMNITGSRSVTLGTAGNPFTITTETDAQTTNGRAYGLIFTGSSRTFVDTTPAGRTLTVGLDSLERLSNETVGGLNPTDFAYDSRGRLASITEGVRKTTLSYNAHGFLADVVDPLKLKTSFIYDADGRVTSTTLPDGRIIGYSYDSNGNVTSITPPGGTPHEFTYSAVDLLSSYTPPTVSGGGATTYTYSLDRDLTKITRPDGKVVSYGYDTAGRLISVTEPTGKTTYAYNATTGSLASETRGAERIVFSFNGSLPTKFTWSGPVAGSVSRTYNDNFWIASEEVNGANTIVAQHDNDGLLTKVGALAIRRNAKNGLITGTTLGVTTDARTYNAFGELTGYTAAVNGSTLYSVTYTRDDDARVSSKTETIAGATNDYTYTYDLAGRLADVKKNGVTDTYTYDSNSNRLTGSLSSGTSTGTYDAQDRLLTYGNASYTYTANGEVTSQTVASQKTLYSYDAMGNLIAATLPNGTQLTYVIDPENRRVGKEVNGVLQSGFLYYGDAIVAELNGSNQLLSRFVYATNLSPDYMVAGGVTYRIFSDQLGSPVLVVNTTTGAIVEQITYDEFGNVIGDTNPGLQPFGFAGGLYDQDTKLVRFGERDFNSATGRWTAKDLTLFGGGDTNLYGYVLADPVNLVDPAGGEGVDAGTPQGGSSTGTKVMEWVVDSAKDLQQAQKRLKQCRTLKKGVNAARNGVEGVEQLAVDEAKGTVKSKTGTQNEEVKQVLDQTQQTASSIDTNPLTDGIRTSANALAGQSKPCPKCKDQARPPNPIPHHPRPPSEVDDPDLTVPVNNPSSDDY